MTIIYGAGRYGNKLSHPTGVEESHRGEKITEISPTFLAEIATTTGDRSSYNYTITNIKLPIISGVLHDYPDKLMSHYLRSLYAWISISISFEVRTTNSTGFYFY